MPQSMDCRELLGILIVKVLATAITFNAYLTTGVTPPPVSILPYVVKPMYHLPMAFLFSRYARWAGMHASALGTAPIEARKLQNPVACFS